MKRISTYLAVPVASLSLLAGQAMAAVPTEVTSAISDAKADAVEVAGAVLVIVFAVLAFRYMRREAK